MIHEIALLSTLKVVFFLYIRKWSKVGHFQKNRQIARRRIIFLIRKLNQDRQYFFLRDAEFGWTSFSLQKLPVGGGDILCHLSL